MYSNNIVLVALFWWPRLSRGRSAAGSAPKRLWVAGGNEASVWANGEVPTTEELLEERLPKVGASLDNLSAFCVQLIGKWADRKPHESGKSVEARQALLKGMDKRGTDDPASDDWFVLGRIAENYGVRDVAIAAYKRVEKGELTGTTTWELTQRRIAAMPIGSLWEMP